MEKSESPQRNQIKRKAEEARLAFSSYSQRIPSSLVSAVAEKKGLFCIFLGAGAGKASGLPLGNELRDIILEKIYGGSNLESKFREEFASQAPKEQEITLEMVIQALRSRFGNRAYEFLTNFMNGNKIPAEGYWALANLVANGFLKVVMTTNFDEIIERALDEGIGRTEYIRICTSDDFKSFEPEKNPSLPQLIKLHGTYTLPSTLVASWTDIQKLSPIKSEFLNYYSLYFHVIFVGYSGRDPDVRKALLKASVSKRMKIFWVSPNDLGKAALEVLGWFDSECNHLRMTSDDFFCELEERLTKAEARLENEVSATIIGLGASNENTAVDAFEIAAGILYHQNWGPKAKRHYHESFRRLVKDVSASCEALLKKGHLDGCVGDGIMRRYYD